MINDLYPELIPRFAKADGAKVIDAYAGLGGKKDWRSSFPNDEQGCPGQAIVPRQMAAMAAARSADIAAIAAATQSAAAAVHAPPQLAQSQKQQATATGLGEAVPAWPITDREGDAASVAAAGAAVVSDHSSNMNCSPTRWP